MTRVLHLLGRVPDHPTEHALRALQRRADLFGPAAVRAIGHGGAYANLLRAVIGLRRETGAFDVVHAWDDRALVAAALAGKHPIVFSAPSEVRRRDVERLRLVMRHRDVRVVCSTAAQQDRLEGSGTPPDRLHVIRPAVDVPASPLARDSDLRRRLGIGDDDFVLVAGGESTRAAAHERAVWTGSILHVTDERYRVLLWGRGPRAGAAAALGGKLRQPGLVVVVERALGRPAAFEDLLPAADAMLVTGREPVSPLPLALAMAAGVPVISAETPFVRELRSSRPFALTPPADAPRLLAQCVLELRDDESLRARLVAEGRAAATQLFSPRSFAESYRALCVTTSTTANVARRPATTPVNPSFTPSDLAETRT